MKNLTLLFIGLLFTSNMLYSQVGKTHFDNKSFIDGEMIVQILDNVNLQSIVDRAPASYGMQVVEELSPPMRIWLLKFDEQHVQASQIQYWLYNQPEITVADYNYHVQMRSTMPGDPQVTSQWHHNNTGAGAQNDADIDSDLAWDITQGGQTAYNDDIVVCMVEGGGGNLNHQDLSPNRWTNPNEIDGNGIDDDGNGYIDDYEGWNTGSNNDNTGTGSHGTNCLGMIGAKGDNGLNVVGANWDVKLMVLNMGGSLSQSNVIQAYTYPLVMRQAWNNSGGTLGAFVVATSASWGIDGANPNAYPLWCQFYDTLGYYGIINVGATTNQNLDVDVAGDMPTGCTSDYMVGVGRSDNTDNTAGGYGDQTINFAAPGINVLTTNGTTGTTTTTGTSFSCPLTAGVIGLAYSIPCSDFMDLVIADPQGGADAVLYALNNGVDVKPQLANKFIYGGRLNSRNTLDTLMAMTCNVTVCDFSVSETVNQPPCAGFDNGSISLGVSGGVPGYTYDWGLNGGDVSNLSSLGPGSYFVVITDNSGCDTVINYILDYSVNLDVTINATNVSCNGAADGMVVAVGSGSSGYNYQWLGGPAADTWSPLTPGTYNVTVTDTNGCTATDGVTITEPAVAISSFTWSDNYLAVTFTNSSQGGPVEWDFGDGFTSTSWNTSHIYASEGTYTVCLTVFGACDTVVTCEDITIFGLNVSLLENSLSNVEVYPNPTDGVVNFIFHDNQASSIELLDMIGRSIKKVDVEGDSALIDLGDLNMGTYFYRIVDEAGELIANDKLVISK